MAVIYGVGGGILLLTLLLLWRSTRSGVFVCIVVFPCVCGGGLRIYQRSGQSAHSIHKPTTPNPAGGPWPMRRGESSPSSTPSGGKCDLGKHGCAVVRSSFVLGVEERGRALGPFFDFVHISTVAHWHFSITRNTAVMTMLRRDTQRARVRVCVLRPRQNDDAAATNNKRNEVTTRRSDLSDNLAHARITLVSFALFSFC